MADHMSGLVREIRTATTSDQFDLAGYSESRVTDLIKNSFSSPFDDAKSMIRCTLVVGGGKLVRARYDDDLIRWTTSALREIGYVEDKSAAETFDSQGTYKTQHDTGQNLKYVIVFPRMNVVSDDSATKEKDVDASSPEYIVSACELTTFQEIVRNKVSSWRQKKRLLKFIQGAQDSFKLLESKLFAGTALSASEQAEYDSNPGNHEEKLTWLQSEIKKLVDEGKVTASEKEELATSLAANIQSITVEIDAIPGENPKRKVLQDRRDAVALRKSTIEKIVPIQRRLKNSVDIQAMRIRLLPLLTLEDKGRSMSLTMADLKLIEEKSDLEARILLLENASRGWFEDEADFQIMCEFEVAEAKVKAARKSQSTAQAKGASTLKPSSSNKPTGWNVVGGKKPTSTSSSSTAKKTGFSAAFADDSD